MKSILPIIVSSFTLILLLSSCASPEKGEDLFTSNKCIDCHSFKGKGGIIGPDLTYINEERTTSWIADYIKNPTSVYPGTRMPSYQKLTYAERKSIASYLTSSD